jgi:chaperone modulatory protein CbpM
MPVTEPHVEWVEAQWLELHHDLSLAELSELSGLPAQALHSLVEWGVLAPADPSATDLRFSAASLTTVRTAARLRADFSLDASGLALALTYLERIQALEAQVRELRAQLPRRAGR